MRIRKIELHGFKSFPDRTAVAFGEGISCVVGPNGSGKSNIADAIKWVIGEQSARALRGGEMADVIFAGSAERAPSGFAEVAMTLCADDGEPFPGEYARLSELSVGRRLHRSGASEYFLNLARCRRRDITDLFLDTGVATDLYCFIEQGSVGKIVHATPAERRALIEEAAGISRYKARRQEADGRLLATATQLDRAADVADEMGRRLRALERQVMRAATWRRLRALVRQDEIVLAMARYADLAATRRRLRTEHRVAVRAAEVAEREVARRDSELAQRREELEVVEAAVSRWRDEVAELDAGLREAGATLEYTRRRGVELAAEAERLSTEAAGVATAVERAQAECVEADAQVAGHLAALAQADDALAVARRAAAEAGDALDAARRAAADALARAARHAAERAAGEALREDLFARRNALAAEIEQLAADYRASEDRRAEATADRDRRRAALARLREALGPSEGPGGAPSDPVAQARGEARALVEQAEQEGAAARDASLMGAQAERDRAWSTVDDARGALAAVEQELASLVAHERELDGVLAGLDHAIAADGTDGVDVDAATLAELAGPDRLGDEGLVGALGFRLSLPVLQDADRVHELSAVVGTGRAVQVLWLPDGPQGATLVPGLALVDTLAEALAHHRATGGTAAVRSTGERVDSDGVVTLGDAGARARERIERLRERDRAARERAEAVARREAHDRVRTTAADRLHLYLRAAEHADAALRGAEGQAAATLSRLLAQARARADERVDAARRDADAERAAAQELDTAAGELKHAEAQVERWSEGAAAAETRLGRARQAHEALSVRLAALKPLDAAPEGGSDTTPVALSAAERADRTATDALSELSVRKAALTGRLEGARSVRAGAGRRVEELRAREGQLEARQHEIAAAGATIESQVSEVASRIDRSTQARAAAWDQLQVHRERLSVLKAAAMQVEARVREAGKERDEAARAAAELEVRVGEARVEIEALRRRVDERYLLSLPGLLDRLDAQGRVVVETDARARQDAAIGGRVVEGVPDHTVLRAHLHDYDAIAARVERLEERRSALAALGEVSLGALDEYEDVRGRHRDLVAQQTDLEQSVAAIRKAIAKMNRTCRQRFRDTFDRVTAELSQLYPRLTGGGTARLALTDEEDLLEAGVEVFVQPPGKRLQNLGLLSGGEKAMTAIAVLLSLFKVKPSPFCVLDEVDAPLDEVNGARFNEVLREMAGLAQFILITHNRHTMECADTLYGVTMAVPGVSTLVSVRLGA